MFSINKSKKEKLNTFDLAVTYNTSHFAILFFRGNGFEIICVDGTLNGAPVGRRQPLQKRSRAYGATILQEQCTR